MNLVCVLLLFDVYLIKYLLREYNKKKSLDTSLCNVNVTNILCSVYKPKIDVEQ